MLCFHHDSGISLFIPVKLEEFVGQSYFGPSESQKVEGFIKQFFPNWYDGKKKNNATVDISN